MNNNRNAEDKLDIFLANDEEAMEEYLMDGEEGLIAYLMDNKEALEAYLICDEEASKAYSTGGEDALKAYLMCDNKVSKTSLTGNSIQTKGEHRMRCNVCGHIFCYTDEDLKKNAGNAGMGVLSAIGGLASTLGGGSIFHTHHLQSQADRYADKIIDYKRCPSCHSNNISEIKNGEVMQANGSSTPAFSPVEEIKKYKELLDMGIITQEEFDAKKKQLLGL